MSVTSGCVGHPESNQRIGLDVQQARVRPDNLVCKSACPRRVTWYADGLAPEPFKPDAPANADSPVYSDSQFTLSR